MENQVWQKDFTDEHLWTPEGLTRKLRDMHEAPLKLGLAPTDRPGAAPAYAKPQDSVVDITPISPPSPTSPHDTPPGH